MIRIPRSVFERYCYLPYAEVQRAAECGRDGLEQRNPLYVNSYELNEPPEPIQKADEDLDAFDRRMVAYREAHARWEAEGGYAYVREGTDVLSVGKTLLYQQCW